MPQTANLPIGWKSTVKIASANPAQLKLLPRARDWQLTSSEYSSPVPVKVAVEPTQDILSLDLRQAKLPAGKMLMPGVVSHATNLVEHPKLVADRILRYAAIAGRENIIAGTDCGLGGRVHADLAWAKLHTLVEGARLASKSLWP